MQFDDFRYILNLNVQLVKFTHIMCKFINYTLDIKIGQFCKTLPPFIGILAYETKCAIFYHLKFTL